MEILRGGAGFQVSVNMISVATVGSQRDHELHVKAG
ncbi:hypothetical protein E3A20_21880, partial [Planctomyces bekefii]